MCEPDFWTISADAMELTIKGNRLIVQEVAEALHRWWRGLPPALRPGRRKPGTSRKPARAAWL